MSRCVTNVSRTSVRVRLSGLVAGVVAALGVPALQSQASAQVLEETVKLQFGSVLGDVLADVGFAVDKHGMVGSTRGDLGGPNLGGSDVVVARADAQGLVDWVRQLGSSQDEYGTGVVVDQTGGIIVTGQTTGDMAGPGSNMGGFDLFVAGFDSVGNETFRKQYGSGGNDFAMDATSDGQGGLYIGGYTSGSFLGPNLGDFDVFIMRLDSNGDMIWGDQFGTFLPDFGVAVARDGANGVFIAGDTDGNIGGPNQGGPDLFVRRLDNQGNISWSAQVGSPGWDLCNAVAPDLNGGVFVGGSSDGAFSGPGFGFDDAVVARIDSTGVTDWTKSWGTPFEDAVFGLAPNGEGGVYAAGTTRGDLFGLNAGERDAIVIGMDANGTELSAMQHGTPFDDAVTRAVSSAEEGPFTLCVVGSTTGDMGAPNAGLTDAMLIAYAKKTGPCYPDCDQSTGVGVLDIFDFLCFQDSWVNGKAYACGCDTSTGPGVCDIFDFICFQNAFVVGCP